MFVVLVPSISGHVYYLGNLLIALIAGRADIESTERIGPAAEKRHTESGSEASKATWSMSSNLVGYHGSPVQKHAEDPARQE